MFPTLSNTQFDKIMQSFLHSINVSTNESSKCDLSSFKHKKDLMHNNKFNDDCRICCNFNLIDHFLWMKKRTSRYWLSSHNRIAVNHRQITILTLSKLLLCRFWIFGSSFNSRDLHKMIDYLFVLNSSPFSVKLLSEIFWLIIF